MRTIRLGVTIMALALAAGCTADDDDTGPDPVDRLVILDVDGRVVTTAPDGSDPRVLSVEDDVAFQPIWSPDGTKVAYASVADGGVTVADTESSDRANVATEIGPFYLHWSPDGGRIAALRNTDSGIALEMVTVGADELTTTLVDSGSPYYFSWSPQSDELVVHAGTDRFDLLDTSGNATPMDVPPGLFLAPHWTDQGIVSSRAESGVSELVLVSGDGGVQVIAEHPGAVTFAADPSGRRVAVQPVGGAEQGGIIDASLRTGPVVDEPLAHERLQVVDLESGDVATVADEPVVAFFWSPDGARLLVLDVEPEGRLAWSVWTDGELVEGPTFVPDNSWVQAFLPFYDQYARSMTLWAPDGSAFAFPGERDDEAGIWVHDVESGETSKVADGTWVAWSHS